MSKKGKKTEKSPAPSERDAAREARFDKKKLVLEFVVVVAIFGIVWFIRALPGIQQSIANHDKYAANKDVYNKAINYDYSKGRDLEFESYLDTQASNQNVSDNTLYFNLMARGYYYCHQNMYKTGQNAYFNAIGLAPDQENAAATSEAASKCMSEDDYNKMLEEAIKKADEEAKDQESSGSEQSQGSDSASEKTE